MAIDRAKVRKEAEKFLSAGRLDRAIDEYRKMLDDNPKDLATMNTIGDLCIQANRLSEGVDIFKRLAHAYERDGFAPKATAILQKTLRSAPDDMDIATRLADLYRQTGKIKEAVSVHLQVAEQFSKKGLFKRALEEFAKVVDLDPKNLKNKVKLADLYNKEGMKDRAASIYLEVAEALAIEQMHGEAHQILERAKTMTTSPQVFLTQSRLSVIQGDFAGAANHLREGLQANQRSNELLEALAEIEIRSGNPDRALEALAQVPQLPEKSVHLCEKALRLMGQNNRAEEGLRLFAPIGRELARRGMGDAVTRALKSGLQQAMTADAWSMIGEFAHQSGKRDEQIAALQTAHAMSEQAGDAVRATQFLSQLQELGAVAGAPLPPHVPGAPRLSSDGPVMPGAMEDTKPGWGHTEMDPLKRLKMDQLAREAEGMIRSGSPDRAVDAYKKALELDPANFTLIEAIAEIHRGTGMLTRVQQQYLQSAQQLHSLGKSKGATHLLDKAEQMFPGSTRIHRRTMGLPDFNPSAPTPAPAAEAGFAMAPAPAAFAPPPLAPPPMEAPPAPIPMPPVPAAPVGDLDALIALDMPDFGAPARPAFSAPMEPAALDKSLPGLPLMPFDAPMAEPPAVAPSDFGLPTTFPDAASAVAAITQSASVPAPIIASHADITRPPTAMPIMPPELTPEVSAQVPEELEALLSDIDFQLDYGSPEEAKIELENALVQFPNHPELKSRLERAEQSLRKLGKTLAPAAGATPLEENDFTNSFFDLTDVLGTALMDSGEGEEMHDATRVVEKVQSVEELFSAFRDGVEKQVKGDDYDTHYNLGIAYKEMMLLEPAIEEFKVSMGDPERTIECCSMLAICEQARGDMDAAVKWLKEGIEAPGFPPEDSIGLRYDLAEFYLQMGHNAMATDEFRKVHEIDPEYRDVEARLS
jgi:tetratricopeptide (TPR) repeat protein